MRMNVKWLGQEKREIRKIKNVFYLIYIYIASLNLFSSVGKSEKYSHWTVRSSNETE